MPVNFKYCYKDEIHKSFNISSSLNELIQDIKVSFKNNSKLPSNFSLRYKDNDGDFITISSDAEYNAMLQFDTPNCRTSFKIFIVSSRSSSSTDDKEGSFEVIDSSQNTSQGGISEFSLTSKDCDEEPTERQNNISSHKDDAPSEEDRAPANSPQRSKVLMDNSDWKDQDEQLSFPDVDESGSIGEEALNEAYKAVVSTTPEQELASPSLSAGSDMNVSLGREKMENSLERIFDRMEPLDLRNTDYREAVVHDHSPSDRADSRDNSIVLREITNFEERLAEQKREKIEGCSVSEIRPMFNAGRIMPLDLFDRRRREKIMKRRDQAARVIQKVFRANQTRRRLYELRENHFKRQLDFLSSNEALHGLTNHIKARLQALIEAQIPRAMDTCEPINITPREVSFEIRRPTWDLDDTEPAYDEESNRHSFEKSVRERCEESPMKDTSLDDLICCDPSYREQIKRCLDYYDYKSSSDRILSLHDSRVQSPYLGDLLNQSESQAVDDTRLELPVVDMKPVNHLNYRVMLGMSSSLLFLGGEEGQGVVYKTVYLENTGTKPWRKCYVKSVGLIEGKTLEFYNVDVGEISLVTLELNGYFDVGTYNSEWKLIHENENGMVEPIGEPFEIEFAIEPQNIINTLESLLPRRFTDEYPPQDFIYKYLGHTDEDQHYPDSVDRNEQDQQEQYYDEEQEERYEEEEEEEDNEEEEEEYEDEEEEEEYEEEEQYEDEEEYDEEEEYEEEEEEEQEEEEEEEEYNERQERKFNKYSDYREEILKIREMRKIFPLDNLDELIEFVDNRPQLTIEELLIGYLALKNNY